MVAALIHERGQGKINRSAQIVEEVGVLLGR